MPFITLLVAPVLGCFLAGVAAAAARPTLGPAPAPPAEWPDNVIRLDPARRGA